MDTTVELSREEMINGATRASNLLKTLSHKDRLLILCELKAGEKSVGELGNILNYVKCSVYRNSIEKPLNIIII